MKPLEKSGVSCRSFIEFPNTLYKDVLGHDLGDDLILALEFFFEPGDALLGLVGGARAGALAKAAAPFSKKVFCHW
jgi:hypothetical protein